MVMTPLSFPSDGGTDEPSVTRAFADATPRAKQIIERQREHGLKRPSGERYSGRAALTRAIRAT